MLFSLLITGRITQPVKTVVLVYWGFEWTFVKLDKINTMMSS